jgi:hypothetical protein
VERFILHYQGDASGPAEDAERLCKIAGAKVIDGTLPRTVLVEGFEDALRAALDQTKDWVLSRERSYALPPSHPVVGKARGLKPPG